MPTPRAARAAFRAWMARLRERGRLLRPGEQPPPGACVVEIDSNDEGLNPPWIFVLDSLRDLQETREGLSTYAWRHSYCIYVMPRDAARRYTTPWLFCATAAVWAALLVFWSTAVVSTALSTDFVAMSCQ